jgi:Family of unknown function (DUF5677)
MRNDAKRDGLAFEDLCPPAYEVKWSDLAKPTSEDPFGEASFELLKEAGILSHLAAGLLPNSALPRDRAILYALMLKASKLARELIAMTAQLGTDRQLALVRELLECLATLSYLLGDDGTGARFQQYVEASLVAEREFLKTIHTNVKARGSTLEIEASMERSIERTAAAAGIDDVKQLPGRQRIGWPKAEDLLKELGENTYPPYRSGSSVLHTMWSDILRNHLKENEDGTFDLRFDDTDPRPQPLYAAGLLLGDLTRAFLAKVRPDALDEFKPRLDDLEKRLLRVAELHGAWLDNLDAAD